MSDSTTWIQPGDTLFVDFRIATMCDSDEVLARDANGDAFYRQSASPYGLIEDAILATRDGQIAWILPRESMGEIPSNVVRVEGGGRLLTPGLIDCHTHLVYGGNRAGEWEARLQGASYEEIARAGGGILSSVVHTRAASEEELVQGALGRLAPLMAEGVTTVEIKSGYGLNVETELKMLRAAARVGEEAPVDVHATLLGAHAVPPEFKGRPDDYVDLVCDEMIPAAKGLCSAVDAFCESIAFDVAQTTRVFRAAQDHGLAIKVHAEQLSDLGMAAEAARMGALSADHLEYLSDADARILAEQQTVATLLPGAFYCLKETQKPPVPALLAAGAPIAIATDANPGSSPVGSLLMMGNMACNLFGLTPEQAWRGMTRFAAQALGLQERAGRLGAGFDADLAIWDVAAPAEVLYPMGGVSCWARYKRGVRA